MKTKEYRHHPDVLPAAQQRAREHKRERRAWIDSLKSGPCVDCGRQFPPYAMDFDHRDGEIKLFNVGNGATLDRDRVLAEIAKCDLVCANCHRVRTELRRHLRNLKPAVSYGTDDKLIAPDPPTIGFLQNFTAERAGALSLN